MKTDVLKCDWGGANRGDIQKLLENAASQIEQELRVPPKGEIQIVNRPNDKGPIVYYRDQDTEPYKVKLAATGGCCWSQLAFQFGHEFCHILSRYERLQNSRNKWFHESICVLASLFVLCRMAECWQTHPLFDHCDNYSTNLDKYAKNRIDKSEAITPRGSFRDWLLENEDHMRCNPRDREKNGIIAVKLLPLFENDRCGWNAVQRLPASSARIEEYIDVWKANVEAVDRLFVENVGNTLLGL